nr:uncharacterized protein LOC109151229 [Ipomoea batatas]
MAYMRTLIEHMLDIDDKESVQALFQQADYNQTDIDQVRSEWADSVSSYIRSNPKRSKRMERYRFLGGPAISGEKNEAGKNRTITEYCTITSDLASLIAGRQRVSSRVVPNSTSESTVPTISKGQLTDTVPIQSLPFQQYPTNMIWSIPSSRNSLSSFNEYSYHITGNTSQPMMAQKNVDSPMPPTNNPEDLSAVVDVVANNKMKQVGSTQSQVQSTNSLPGISSESMPIMNGVYNPMYEELGLPVDPHLRCLMLKPNFIRALETKRVAMPDERIRKTRGGAGPKGDDKVDRSEKAENGGGQRGVMVVPNSTSESTVPTISKGQLTDTVPIQSLPFQQYPTNMIWSIPSSRNSLSSFNELFISYYWKHKPNQ